MRIVSLLFLAFILSACKAGTLTTDELLHKQVYQMTPQEVNRYIAHMAQAEPDLRKRIAAIGRQNIGQPYMLNLLGEYPYELHDALPMFSLEQSDCVVFAEHTYAMALSRSWEEFFWMLQRIRYKDGVIGVATRNHYTEVDWNANNNWLVTDVSASLGGADAMSYELKVDRARFLRMRHQTLRDIPVQTSREWYVGKDKLAPVLPQLREGDLVNVVSTRDGAFWVSHVGLIVISADGQRNFLNSAEPQVREESFTAFFQRTAERELKNAKEGRNGQKLAGFKFLRLNDNIVVPPMAPQPRPVPSSAEAVPRN
ncbi:N-acetylmuramoyl-L-alanine amidase-like domain-containing protein [Massilia sp. TSP1-1-2]|uniref:N-acetylmuramoyl-L-alanine amidase-like domain-containing protein n=1 Tax=Massilia sp. TSP1-1-2 TaxID=2804649 RepID=UPI003CE896B4